MKLRNKKTGEIGHFTSTNWNEIALIIMDDDGVQLAKYSSLAGLNEDWEDYEEPKEFWFVDSGGEVEEATYLTDNDKSSLRSFGNYFDTKEEAEKAVEKLRAWKVLKDMGFKIAGIRYRNNKNYVEWSIPQKVRDDYYAVSAFNEALHLLFGGEQ